MSWFKRRSDSKASQRSSETSSLNSDGMVEKRCRCDTDPDTCLEVFRNHWEQADKIIDPGPVNDSRSTPDEIQTVSQNFEQMVTLLSDEEGEEGQGMPGPILHYLLEHEILEKFCGWCHRNSDESGKLIKEQLRMFEHLISQSHQLLLIHKPVIRPLLNLLAYCGDDIISSDIEQNLVLVLHQACVSISKEKVILESFFNMNADHGPTKFLIFSLLIPYLHRDGSIGQQARDALLLIMALSAKHPYIGKYIAENSDFCPVLATGLSALYSDLPRKIEIPYEDWYQITEDDVQNIPEMAMFLNSLEFCNAVAQIAHPLVRDQLVKYIHDGFLVLVLGPALHQNGIGFSPMKERYHTMRSDLLWKKISSECQTVWILMRRRATRRLIWIQTVCNSNHKFASSVQKNSREEVITATAYLDLFLRRVSEPTLIKAFLMFIFTEKNDEIIILDSLITRINSSSKLCLVSLSLFHTLVDLNCEDVMFDLVFKYLIPCTHVMVSQRRSVRDQDVYSKSVEKFLSLRPTCCLPEIDSPKHNLGDLPGLPKLTNPTSNRSKPKFFRLRKERSKSQLPAVSELKVDNAPTSFPPGTFGSKLEHFETSYLEYLHDAHQRLLHCSGACLSWQYPYNGETPPPSNIEIETGDESQVVIGQFGKKAKGFDESNIESKDEVDSLCLAKGDCIPNKSSTDSISCDKLDNLGLNISSAIDRNVILTDEGKVENAGAEVNYATEEEFLSMLEESESPRDRSQNIDDSMKTLESVLSNISFKSISRTSTPRKELQHDGTSERFERFPDFNETGELSTVYFDCESSRDELDEEFKSVNETSFEMIEGLTKSKTVNATEFEIVDDKQVEKVNNNNTSPDESKVQDQTSFLDISLAKGDNSELSKSKERKSDDTDFEVVNTNENTSAPGAQSSILSKKEAAKPDNSKQAISKGDKSVRFAETTVRTIHDMSTKVGLLGYKQANSPDIGPFLRALLDKLEGMMQNSLLVNLMLTGLISRLACYAQPLLRSFLLNHNLVFQPTVKSLVQVLTLVRQKVDHYSYTVENFEALLLRARRTLAQREGILPERSHSLSPSPEMVHNRLRTSTVSDIPSKEKRHRTLTELLFRKTPNEKKALRDAKTGAKDRKLEIQMGSKNVRFVNRKQKELPRDSQVESAKTRNAVYCAIVLEEFVKELAALTQEHSVLHMDDETYISG